MSDMSGKFNADLNDRPRDGQRFYVVNADLFNTFFRGEPFQAWQVVEAIRKNQGKLCFKVVSATNNHFTQEFQIGGLALNKSITKLGLGKVPNDLDFSPKLPTSRSTAPRTEAATAESIRKAMAFAAALKEAGRLDGLADEAVKADEVAAEETEVRKAVTKKQGFWSRLGLWR